MDPRLVEGLANTGILLGCAIGLWAFWRLQARRNPEAFAPLLPSADPALVHHELAAERRASLERLDEARRQLEKVDRAFRRGADGGRRR